LAELEIWRLNTAVNIPSVWNSGSGRFASLMASCIRGIPDATLSTKCIRVNKLKISGLRVMLLCPKSLATTGRSPPGLEISTRSSNISIIMLAPCS
jgi:hypothetical protein